MIVLHPKTLKVSTTEDYGSEVGVDNLEKSLCRGKMQVGSGNIGISSVAVDSNLL
jgi:hypothetical protein